MFGEVPVLPVVVPLATAVLAGLLVRLRRRRHLTAPRAAVAVVVCVYVAGVVANTVFPIYLDAPRQDATWTVYLVPLTDYEVVDALTNVLVFLPVGALLPLLMAAASWRRVLAVAVLFSLGIEMTQLVTGNLLGGGHVADVNDLLFNVVGAALGLALFTALTRVPVATRVLDRFRWR